MAALTRPILDGREMPVSPIVAASPRGSTSRHLAGSGWAAARIRVVGPDGHRHAGDTIPIHVIETDVSSGLTSSRAACLFTAGRGVGQQRHLAGVLHRDRDVALMSTAVPADPARPNLAPVGEKLTQQASVLVIDLLIFVLAKRANLLLVLARYSLCRGSPDLRLTEVDRVGAENLVTGADLGVRSTCQTSRS